MRRKEKGGHECESEGQKQKQHLLTNKAWKKSKANSFRILEQLGKRERQNKHVLPS